MNMNNPSTPGAPEPQVPDNDKVICPACVHQFRAIPVNVQALLLAAGFEPPFLGAPPAGTSDAAQLLFSFGGFLTSSEQQRVFSSHDDATPMIEAIRLYAEREGIDLNPAPEHASAPEAHPPRVTVEMLNQLRANYELALDTGRTLKEVQAALAAPTPGAPEALSLFKTTVMGVGPFCIEFPDGEIIYTRTEARQLQIAAALAAPSTPAPTGEQA